MYYISIVSLYLLSVHEKTTRRISSLTLNIDSAKKSQGNFCFFALFPLGNPPFSSLPRPFMYSVIGSVDWYISFELIRILYIFII